MSTDSDKNGDDNKIHDAMKGTPEEETQEQFEKRMRHDRERNGMKTVEEPLVGDPENREVESDASIVDRFIKFLKEFKNEKGGGEYYYFAKIEQLYSKEDKTLLVRYTDLPPELFDYFFRSRTAEQNLGLLTDAAQMIFEEIYSSSEVDRDIIDRINAKLTIEDRDMVTPMKRIDVRSLGRLVVFDSTIVSKTATKTTVRKKAFVCRNCNHVHQTKHNECPDCGEKRIVFSALMSKPINVEYIEVQELQNELLSGSSVPIQKQVKVYGELTNKFKPGDTVRIIGFPKLEKSLSDTQLNKSISSEESDEFSDDVLFDDVIEAHNIEMLGNTGESIIENPAKLITEQDRLLIQALRNKYKNDDDGLLAVIINSFAPYIYGHEQEKFAILLQAVGSTPISLDRATIKKAQINILLVGDPGVTKSMLLEAAMKINLHAKSAVGKGASGVGLTAGIDPDAKGMSKLKVGAVVLANNGVCCIDEFSHITPENKAHLLECMAQGTISINKGGINAILSAKTALLVATNPDAGKYSKFNSLKENVKITDQLISRFDIIFVIIDTVDRELDNKIIKHITDQYDYNTRRSLVLEKSDHIQRIDPDLLFKYITYAKINNTKNIGFTPEARKRIADFYHELRQGKEGEVTATARQLEGIIRLCISLCRMMLRDVVTEDDAIKIITLLTKAYMSAGFISFESAGMNMTAEYAKPIVNVAKPLAFTRVMQKLTDHNKNPVPRNAILAELVREARWDLAMATEFFDKMDIGGKIRAPHEVNGTKVWVLNDGGGNEEFE